MLQKKYMPIRPSMRDATRARIAILFQTLFSAGTFLVVKHVLGTASQPGRMSGLQLLTLRFAVAGALLGVAGAAQPAVRNSVLRQWRACLALGFVAVPLNVGLFFEGAARTSASHAALAYALTPVFVFILERLLGRTTATLRRIAGLVLAMAGAAFVLLQKASVGGPEPVGDLMLLFAALSWAVYTVFSKPLVATEGSVAVLTGSLVAGSLLWIPAGMYQMQSLALGRLTLSDWAGVLYTGIITTIVSYALWLYALKRLESTQVAIFTNLQPVATVLLAWILLGETVEPAVLAATAFILTGVTLVQFKPPVAPTTPRKEFV